MGEGVVWRAQAGGGAAAAAAAASVISVPSVSARRRARRNTEQAKRTVKPAHNPEADAEPANKPKAPHAADAARGKPKSAAATAKKPKAPATKPKPAAAPAPAKYSDLSRALLQQLRDYAAGAGLEVPKAQNNRTALLVLLCEHYGLHAGNQPEHLRTCAKVSGGKRPSSGEAGEAGENGKVDSKDDSKRAKADEVLEDDEEIRAARAKLAAAQQKADEKAKLLAELAAQTALVQKEADATAPPPQTTRATDALTHPHTHSPFQSLAARFNAGSNGAVLNYYSKGAFEGAHITMCAPTTAPAAPHAPHITMCAQPPAQHPTNRGFDMTNHGAPGRSYQMTPRELPCGGLDERFGGSHATHGRDQHPAYRGFG